MSNVVEVVEAALQDYPNDERDMILQSADFTKAFASEVADVTGFSVNVVLETIEAINGKSSAIATTLTKEEVADTKSLSRYEQLHHELQFHDRYVLRPLAVALLKRERLLRATHKGEVYDFPSVDSWTPTESQIKKALRRVKSPAQFPQPTPPVWKVGKNRKTTEWRGVFLIRFLNEVNDRMEQGITASDVFINCGVSSKMRADAKEIMDWASSEGKVIHTKRRYYDPQYTNLTPEETELHRTIYETLHNESYALSPLCAKVLYDNKSGREKVKMALERLETHGLIEQTGRQWRVRAWVI